MKPWSYFGVVVILFCISADTTRAGDTPSPQQLIQASRQVFDLSSIYPYQVSGHVLINQGTPFEKTGTVTIYRDNVDYRYELQVEDYREIIMRKGDKLYTSYSAFPAPGLGVIRSFDKWPKSLSSKTVLGHSFKKRIAEIEAYCFEFKIPAPWRSRACFDSSKSSPLEISDQSQKKTFLNYQAIGEKQFPATIRIVRPDLKQNIEIDAIHIQKLEPDTAILEVPKVGREFEICDDQQPAERLTDEIPSPWQMPIFRGTPLMMYFYGIIDQKGGLHDLAIYSPSGSKQEQTWKEIAKNWRFKPATCNGKPVTSELQFSIVVKTR